MSNKTEEKPAKTGEQEKEKLPDCPNCKNPEKVFRIIYGYPSQVLEEN